MNKLMKWKVNISSIRHANATKKKEKFEDFRNRVWYIDTQKKRQSKEKKKTWTCRLSLAPLKSEREEVRRDKEGWLCCIIIIFAMLVGSLSEQTEEKVLCECLWMVRKAPSSYCFWSLNLLFFRIRQWSQPLAVSWSHINNPLSSSSFIKHTDL